MTFLPIVKLDAGQYLIGTKVRTLHLKGSQCLVRTGKGSLPLEQYLEQKAKSECISLNKLVSKGDGTLRFGVIALLEKFNGGKAALNQYDRKYQPAIDRKFQDAIKQLKNERQDNKAYCATQDVTQGVLNSTKDSEQVIQERMAERAQ